jgi:ketosteroid isomerase-like protein
MRIAAVLLATVAVVALAAEPADLVREAAEGWTKAAVKQDAAGLQRYMAEDLQYAHAGGQTQTRDQYIAAVTKGPARYESFTFSDLKVKLYGKAAVLTGFVDVKMVAQEAFRVRTLQVYTENNGQWQMAAHQSTRLGR